MHCRWEPVGQMGDGRNGGDRRARVMPVSLPEGPKERRTVVRTPLKVQRIASLRARAFHPAGQDARILTTPWKTNVMGDPLAAVVPSKSVGGRFR